MASYIGPAGVGGNSSQPPISLALMLQQPGLIGMAEDWTGTTSPAERRKLQNRINQRAYRKLHQSLIIFDFRGSDICVGIFQIKKLLADAIFLTITGKRKAKETKSRRGNTISVDPETKDFNSHESACSIGIENYSDSERKFQDELWRAFAAAATPSKPDCSRLGHIAGVLAAIQTQNLVSEFKEWVQKSFMMGSLTKCHLLEFIKLNVFRAMVSNSKDLGLKLEENMPDDALSPFTDPSSTLCRSRPLPSALRPTKLQREIPHHPWIDLLPIPGMRDNLLRAGDSYDEGELCGDLVGVFGGTAADKTALIVWGEPWEPRNWEVTESFLSQWAWTIRGCSQLFESTNYWRERRGEKPFKFERILCE